MKHLIILFIWLLLSCAIGTPQMWIFSQHNLQVTDNVNTVKGLIDRGVTVGYNGLIIADYKLSVLNSGFVPSYYWTNLNQIISYAKSKKWAVIAGVWPFGYSDALFQTTNNWNLAEPLLHANASFVVSSSGTLMPRSCCEGPADGGFENHNGNTFTSWSWQDARIVADTLVHYSGSCSARMNAGSGNARIVINGYPIKPWKMYHVQVYFKTTGFSGGAQVEILDGVTGNSRNFNIYHPASTQDWTALDFVFNSMSSTTIGIYIGNWGGSSGTLWMDNFRIIEYPLFNVVQRLGAPFRVYDPTNGHTYIEGTDYNIYNDPAVATGYLNNYHAVPPVTLPSGTSLTPGKVVQIDYYGVIPAYNSQVGACLTHPDVNTYMINNVKSVSDAFPAGTGIFLGYDEMRHMHSCQLCQAAAVTAGQLLANHVAKSANLFKNYVNATGSSPNANSIFYFWSDMFDPYHNAVQNYFYVPTTIANSWTTLPSNSVIFNWNLGNLANSLNWFKDLGVKQLVAGYYDSGDGYGSGQSEVGTTNGITNILGFIYTTWNNDYSQLENYANGILSNWHPGPTTPASTKTPTISPSKAPTTKPATPAPTKAPTVAPTKAPTASPTKAPTMVPTLAPTSVACAAVGEGSTATVTCPTGKMIMSIQFASYGTPSGVCQSFAIGSCHLPNSASVVSSACVGKNICSVGARNDVFGDPCVGTVKRLHIQAACQ